jgi:cellulose 1,4-beta-cellobiosidase
MLTLFFGIVSAQRGLSTETDDHLPKIKFSQCDSNGCVDRMHPVTLDANWRWYHTTGESGTPNAWTNCFDGTDFVEDYCPTDPNAPSAWSGYDTAGDMCVALCGVDNVSEEQWENTYGVTTSADGSELSLKFKQGDNVGSRLYLMEEDGEEYFGFNLLNREFSMDVDVNDLVCGLNGAVYFVDMPLNGNAHYGSDYAGAKYGTGYCDAQCPHDIKYILGEGNNLDWDESASNGRYGACCAEWDIWEANREANAFTNHVCIETDNYPTDTITRCDDREFSEAPDHPTFGFCGDNDGVRQEPNFDARMKSMCDKNGCDFQPYRLGNQDHYGPGPSYQVDSTRPMTVVTQFITDNGQDDGNLSEIRRYYVQDGVQILNPTITIVVNGEEKQYDSLTDEFCVDSAQWYGEESAQTQIGDMYAEKSGMTLMGKQLKKMVLALSLWADDFSQMKWLDSTYPDLEDGEIATNGQVRGRCSGEGQSKEELMVSNPDATVKFANLKFGTIGSTNDFENEETTTRAPVTTQNPDCLSNLQTGCDSDADCCSGSCETMLDASGAATSIKFCASCEAPTTTTTTQQTTERPVTTTTQATTTTQQTTTTPVNEDCATMWSQCGGQNWNGPECCAPLVQHWNGQVIQGECVFSNPWHSSCQPARRLEQENKFLHV